MIGGKPEVASRERSFALALLNYFEVTFWFAVWYSVLVRCGSLKITNSYPSGLSIFRESLAMMLVNSSNTFELTVSWWLWTAMCVQSLAAAIKGSHEAHLTLYTREHYGAYRRRRPTVFAHACKMGLESIVSKRKDSAYFRALA